MSEHTPGERFDRELNVRAIVGFGIVLGLILALSFVAMFAVNRGLLSLRERQAPEAPPLAELSTPVVVPEPRLQTHPEIEWSELRAQQAADLASYRLLDAESGRVQIPIELAMQRLLAQQPASEGEH